VNRRKIFGKRGEDLPLHSLIGGKEGLWGNRANKRRIIPLQWVREGFFGKKGEDVATFPLLRDG
jgi:hypothetical protein